MTKAAYVQIIESLSERIENGELAPGDRLPSERELSHTLGVSRMTVRQAMNALVANGMVYRKHGSGSFVAEAKLEQHADLLVGFSESMHRTGLQPGARLLSSEEVLANRKLAERLAINIGRPVYHIHRIRLANELPIAIENSYFPAERFPDLLNQELEARSIYSILEEDYGVTLKSAEQSLEPAIASDYEKQKLNVQEGSPLMLVERLSFDENDLPVEYAKDVYRGDRTRFIIKSLMRA